MGFFIILIIVVLVFLLAGIRVVNQYQRGVVLTLGKFSGIREPGLRVVVPIFQTMTTVDVRSTPIDVPKQEVITKDNVTVGVDAVVYFRVVDAPKAVGSRPPEMEGPGVGPGEPATPWPGRYRTSGQDDQSRTIRVRAERQGGNQGGRVAVIHFWIEALRRASTTPDTPARTTLRAFTAWAA